MERISVQLPKELLAALRVWSKREGKTLQEMLRTILQAAVDGDDPGGVVAVGTQEALAAFREQQRRDQKALADAVTSGLANLREELRNIEGSHADILLRAIESVRGDISLGRGTDTTERERLRAAITDLQGAIAGLQGRVDRLLEQEAPPARNTASRGRRPRILGGGGGA